MSQFRGGFEASYKRPLEYLLPVTATILRNVDYWETKLFINDRELIAVLFVGRVSSVVISAQKVDYTVVDCGGMIPVTKVVDEGQELQKIWEGSYVRVYGKPSVFNGQPLLNAFKIMKCQSLVEVVQHNTSVLSAQQYIKKYGTDAIEMLGKSSDDAPQMIIDNDDDGISELLHLTESQKQLLMFIKAWEHQNENGVLVNWLSEQLERDVQSDITILLNQGLIWETISEEWVRYTGGAGSGYINVGHTLTQAQRQLLVLIKQEEHQTENGVNVNWLSEHLQRDIRTDLTWLLNEGYIYDTISEEWVKMT